jgi:hypothetical protein
MAANLRTGGCSPRSEPAERLDTTAAAIMMKAEHAGDQDPYAGRGRNDER